MDEGCGYLARKKKTQSIRSSDVLQGVRLAGVKREDLGIFWTDQLLESQSTDAERTKQLDEDRLQFGVQSDGTNNV